MAQIRWYLNSTLLDGWALVDQTAAAAATLASGWVVGTGATFSSEFQAAGGDRASTTFVGNTVPDGTIDITLKDAFRSQYPQIGSFDAGNWTFQFAVVSTVQAGAADGQIVFRVLKANADGSSATEITTAQQTTTIATNVGATDINITATWAAPAWTITNQYLFVQVAWKRTGAGGMTTTNIRLRTGSSATVGTTGLTANFVPGNQDVTGATIASTGVVAGDNTLLYDTGGTPGIGITGTQPGFCGAQTFTGVAGILSAISVGMWRLSNPTDFLYFTVHEGAMNGPLVGTTSSYPISTLPTNLAWPMFTLAVPFAMKVGTVYWIQGNLTRTVQDTINAVSMASYGTSVYAGGQAYNEIAVALGSGKDWGFRLWVGGSHTITLVGPDQNVTANTIASTGTIPGNETKTVGFNESFTGGAWGSSGQSFCGAQSITGPFSRLSKVSFLLQQTVLSGDSLYVTVNQGALNGTVLATSAVVSTDSVPVGTGGTGAYAMIDFAFAPFDLASGTAVIQLYRTGSWAGTIWMASGSNSYSGGLLYDNSGTPDASNRDYGFRLYQIASSHTITVSGPPQTVTADTLASTFTVRQPNVVVGAVTVTTPARTSTFAFYPPSVAAGPVTVTAATLVFPFTLRQPNVAHVQSSAEPVFVGAGHAISDTSPLGDIARVTIDTTGGDFIVAQISRYTPSTGLTFTDSQSNVWQPLSIEAQTEVSVRFYWCASPATSATHEFVVDSTSQVNLTYPSLQVLVFSGMGNYLLDQEAPGAVTPASPRQAGSVTPTSDNAVCIAGIGITSNGGTPSIDEGFAIAAGDNYTANMSMGGHVAYLIQTTAAAQNPAWTFTVQPFGWAANMAVFKPPAGGPTDKTITAVTIASTVTLHLPSVALATGPQTITTEALASTLSLHAPVVSPVFDLSTGLVGHWPMSETGTADAIDQYGTNDLTWEGVAADGQDPIDGTPARAIEHSGVLGNGNRLSHVSNSDLALGLDEAFTIIMRCKFESHAGGGGGFTILAKPLDFVFQWILNGGFNFSVSDSTGTACYIYEPGPSNDFYSLLDNNLGQTFVLAGGYNPTTDKAWIRVNNLARVEVTWTTGTRNFGNPFIVGSYTNGGSGMDGAAGPVSYWKRNLSDAEIDYWIGLKGQIDTGTAVTTQPIASTFALTPPSVAVGAVTVTSETISSTLQLRPASVTVGAVTVALPTLGSTFAATAPSVAAGAVTVMAPARASTFALYGASVLAGPIAVTGATIGSTVVLSEPLIAPAGITVVGGALMPSTIALNPPSVAVGAVTITGPTLSSSAGMFAPSITLSTITVVTTQTIGSVFALNPPSVSVGVVTVTTPALVSSITLRGASITVGAVTVTTPALASTMTLRGASVTVGAVTVTTPALASTLALRPASVTAGAVTVTTPALPSTMALRAATVTTSAVPVTMPTLASTMTFGWASVSQTPATVTVPTLGSSFLLHPGSIAGDAITVAAAHIATTSALYGPRIVVGATTVVTPVFAGTFSATAPLVAVSPFQTWFALNANKTVGVQLTPE